MADSTRSAVSNNRDSLQAVSPFDKTVHVVAYTATSAAMSTAFPADVTLARVAVTTDCHVTQAETPTATTSHTFMPAGSVEYFLVTPGFKLAFVQNSTSGNAYVSECF